MFFTLVKTPSLTLPISVYRNSIDVCLHSYIPLNKLTVLTADNSLDLLCRGLLYSRLCT